MTKSTIHGFVLAFAPTVSAADLLNLPGLDEEILHALRQKEERLGAWSWSGWRDPAPKTGPELISGSVTI